MSDFMDDCEREDALKESLRVQLAGVSEMMRYLNDEPAYWDFVKAHADLCHKVMKTYIASGFDGNEAFELLRLAIDKQIVGTNY